MAKGQRAKTKSRGTEVKRQRVEDDSQDDPATKRPRLDTLLPPHSVKVRFMLKRLDVRVDLSARFCEICFYLTPVRIPDNCINLDCSETTFHLDTLKYSKKFVLDFEYPQGIKVDPSKATAKLDRPGILYVELPVTEMIDLETGKLLRKKSKSAIASNPPAKSDGEGEKNLPNSKKSSKKQPKNEANATTKETVASAPRKKRQDPKKSDEKKNSILEKIEAINDAEDAKRDAKLEKEQAKEEYLNSKAAAKAEKKKKQAALKEASLREGKLAPRTRSKNSKPVRAPLKKSSIGDSQKAKGVSFDNKVRVKKI